MIPALAVAVIPALLMPPLLLSLGIPALFAILPVLPLAYVYGRAIAERKPGRAAVLALAWALALSVSSVASAARSPQLVPSGIWHAASYRGEMVRWIGTGIGAEGNFAQFLPRVLIEYAMVLLLAAFSVGILGLFLGSILLGYMNGYVGWVIANADPRTSSLAAAFLAWPPWPMARVASFVLAGTAAASWGYTRLFDRRGPRPAVRPLFVGSLVLLATDIVLKLTLAPQWRLFLRALLGTSAGIDAGVNG
jgi:hypothetical protein